MSKLRIGHIGAGGFATTFIFPQLWAHAVEPVAVCDVVEERAATAQRRFGFASAYTDFRQMCDREALDAVLVTVGGQGHYEIGRELLQRRVPLYLQKPPAATADQTRELAELAARHGTLCHVGFNLRYSMGLRRARKIIAGEEFGRLSLLVYRYGLVSGRTWRDAVLEQHCHAFDSVLYLGGPVAGVEVRLGLADAARSYAVIVSFAGGAVGTINFASGQTPDKEFLYFEVTGKGTFLHSHGCSEVAWLRAQPGPWWRDPQPDYSFRRGAYGGLGNLETMGYVSDVANFLAAVKGEEPDRSPVGSTIGTMGLCEEILRQIG